MDSPGSTRISLGHQGIVLVTRQKGPPQPSSGHQQARPTTATSRVCHCLSLPGKHLVLRNTPETLKASIYKPESDWPGCHGGLRSVLLAGPAVSGPFVLVQWGPRESVCVPRLVSKREVNTLKGGTVYSSENFCR